MIPQKYISISTQSKKTMHKHIFLLKTAICGFERFIFCFCQENYKTNITVSYKHEF